MKATYRNKRKGDANHNQKNDVRAKLEHINHERTKDNFYVAFDESGNPFRINGEYDLKGHQLWLYEHFYGTGVAIQNAKYEKNSQSQYCRTIEQVYASEKQKPLETIWQFACQKDDIPFEIKAEITKKAAFDTISHTQKEYGDWVKPLSFCLHVDETSPHVHGQQTIGYYKNGVFVPNQSQALKEMGFERPDLTRPSGKYNNALISFTDTMREYFYQRCEERAKQLGYDITIDRTVESPSRRRKSQLEHKIAELEETLTQVKKDLTQATKIADTFLRDVGETQVSRLALEYLDNIKTNNKDTMTVIQNLRNHFHNVHVPQQLAQNEHYQDFQNICQNALKAISDVLEQSDEQIDREQ